MDRSKQCPNRFIRGLQLGSPVLSNKLTAHFKHACGNAGENTRVNRCVTTLKSWSHSISRCQQWAHTRLGMSAVNHGGGRGLVAWLLPDDLWATDRCSECEQLCAHWWTRQVPMHPTVPLEATDTLTDLVKLSKPQNKKTWIWKTVLEGRPSLKQTREGKGAVFRMYWSLTSELIKRANSVQGKHRDENLQSS